MYITLNPNGNNLRKLSYQMVTRKKIQIIKWQLHPQVKLPNGNSRSNPSYSLSLFWALVPRWLPNLYSVND